MSEEEKHLLGDELLEYYYCVMNINDNVLDYSIDIVIGKDSTASTIKIDLNPFTLTTILALWTLYFPVLIWEIARKIKAPKDENDYTTYSKLFGYKKSTKFVLIITLIFKTHILITLIFKY